MAAVSGRDVSPPFVGGASMRSAWERRGQAPSLHERKKERVPLEVGWGEAKGIVQNMCTMPGGSICPRGAASAGTRPHIGWWSAATGRVATGRANT